jgi:hypothetical protein
LRNATDLRNMATAVDSDPDVHIGELVEANDEKRLVNL